MRNKTAKKKVPADSLPPGELDALIESTIKEAVAMFSPERLAALKAQAGGGTAFDAHCRQAAMEVRGTRDAQRSGFAMLRIIQFCGSHPTADDVRRAVGESAAEAAAPEPPPEAIPDGDGDPD